MHLLYTKGKIDRTLVQNIHEKQGDIARGRLSQTDFLTALVAVLNPLLDEGDQLTPPVINKRGEEEEAKEEEAKEEEGGAEESSGEEAGEEEEAGEASAEEAIEESQDEAGKVDPTPTSDDPWIESYQESWSLIHDMVSSIPLMNPYYMQPVNNLFFVLSQLYPTPAGRRGIREKLLDPALGNMEYKKKEEAIYLACALNRAAHEGASCDRIGNITISADDNSDQYWHSYFYNLNSNFYRHSMNNPNDSAMLQVRGQNTHTHTHIYIYIYLTCDAAACREAASSSSSNLTILASAPTGNHEGLPNITGLGHFHRRGALRKERQPHEHKNVSQGAPHRVQRNYHEEARRSQGRARCCKKGRGISQCYGRIGKKANKKACCGKPRSVRRKNIATSAPFKRRS